jgi:hypothetical protein
MMTSRIDTSATLGVDGIAKSILVLRDQNVLLDRDLAALYGVTTKRLNERVKRNLARFPIDFMFQLTAEEETALRSHFATPKKNQRQIVAGGGIYPMRLPNRAWRCSLQCYQLNARLP